jgi:cytochrome c553
MKKILFFAAIPAAFLFAKDYGKIYHSYCIKCHGSDGSKVVKRYHVNYKPLKQLSEKEIVENLTKYANGEVVYSAKTSRLMKKNLEKKHLTSPEDIKGMAKYIKEKLGK